MSLDSRDPDSISTPSEQQQQRASDVSADPSTTSRFRPRFFFCLYIWPCSLADWQPLIDAIRDHPNIDFLIVINPNSGPGDGPPHQAHAQGISALRQARSSAEQCVELVGYVSTRWAEREVDAVRRDIDAYCAWPNELSMDGIFLDESTWHTDGVSHYKELAHHIKASHWSRWAPHAPSAPTDKQHRSGIVVLNPGCWVDRGYCDFVDHVVVHEQTVQSWDVGRLQNLSVEMTDVPRDRFALLLHDGPPARARDPHFAPPIAHPVAHAPDTAFDTRSIVTLALHRCRVGALFLTNISLATDDIYASFGSNFDEFVRAFGAVIA